MVPIRTWLLWTLLLGISTLALAGGESSVEVVLPPVDESTSAPGLAGFLEELRVAVNERNVPFVQAALADDVQIGFEPNEQGANSAATRLADTSSELWHRLESSITFGGTFTSKGEQAIFCMPYTYSAFPDNMDPFEHQVVVEPSIEARTAPGDSGEVIPLPDYAIVRTDFGSAEITEDENKRQWARIYLKGERAYIPAESIRSPIASRACLEKRDERWFITAIVIGD